MVRVNTASGHLEPPMQVIDHNPSPLSDCNGAHTHEVVLSGTNLTNLEVMDLGLDTVTHYTTTDLLINTSPTEVIAMHPGAGPRHMAIHPVAPWAFVLNELDSTISSMPYHRVTGTVDGATSTLSSLRPEESATDMAGGGACCLYVV